LVDPWVTVPAVALTLYKNRAEVQSIFNRIVGKIIGPESAIAVTGMAGVGKTVLFDHVSGKAFNRGYLPPLESNVPEAEKLKYNRKRFTLTVVQGQESPQRDDTLQKAFASKRQIDGVIHVVCNGFTALRDSESQAILAEGGLDTLSKFRELQLKAEIDDFHETAEEIRRSVRRHRNRPWLVIAVDKIDLYASNEDRLLAKKHYASEGGEFYEAVQDLRHVVGTDNLPYKVIPVCAWLEDYSYGTEVVKTQLRTDQRDAYIANFLKLLSELSAWDKK
jgi:GTPase SAR1 family protein